MTNETKSEAEKINAAVAKALNYGLLVYQCDNCRSYLTDTQQTGSLCLKCGCPVTYLTNGIPFATDANTRPEMLASLTWTEKFQLINLQSEGRNYNDISDHLISILELDQPTFAKLYTKVKGLL